VFYVSDTLSKAVQGQFIPLQFNKRSPLRHLWQVLRLILIIKYNKIQLVHAHSRAAGWSSYIACKITRTLIVTTVHGRQSVHKSRKVFRAFGHTVITVAEAIKEQIVQDLGIPCPHAPYSIKIKFQLSKRNRNLEVSETIRCLCGITCSQ